jgi:dTDP-4-dehydrorhamnose reductase
VRIYLTGASGFVGSNLAHVFADRGADVIGPSHSDVDLTDPEAVLRSVRETSPDAIVHTAIWNAFAGLLSDRRRAWDSFVGATRNVVDAANAVGAQVVLISTDWVFDGTQGPAAEDEPPNPIQTYGVLKVLSEQVVHDRAERGTIARIAGVQGVHRARPKTLREQDAGFGYLVASVVDALREGREFTVWDDPSLNTIATPILATDVGILVHRAIELSATGTLHCVGSEHIDRVSLARRAVAAFGLDESLLSVGPPQERMNAPYDTSLDATRTAATLGVTLPDVDALLSGLKVQL